MENDETIITNENQTQETEQVENRITPSERLRRISLWVKWLGIIAGIVVFFLTATVPSKIEGYKDFNPMCLAYTFGIIFGSLVTHALLASVADIDENLSEIRKKMEE